MAATATSASRRSRSTSTTPSSSPAAASAPTPPRSCRTRSSVGPNVRLDGGLRFDRTTLPRPASQWSPRLGAAVAFPRPGSTGPRLVQPVVHAAARRAPAAGQLGGSAATVAVCRRRTRRRRRRASRACHGVRGRAGAATGTARRRSTWRTGIADSTTSAIRTCSSTPRSCFPTASPSGRRAVSTSA